MRILIIEDDLDLANGVANALNQTGYATDVVHTGQNAITICTQKHYQLVILDLGLPDRDGIDVLRTLRKQGLLAPVLILTARYDLHDKISGLDAGADDYLGKPFELGELEARIRALMRRSYSSEVTLSFGGIELNPKSQVATVNGNALNLTAREFAVLELLLKRPKGIVSKSQLFDSLYSLAEDVSPSVIESFISRLRSKLGEASANVNIRSLRGLGYRLEMDGGE
jgi:DNA-binding response OmpR family regulator